MKTFANFVLLLAAAAVVAAPASFTYQGALAGDGGTPLTGSHIVEFRIYEAQTGGTPLWGRAYGVTLNADGVFNVAIGDTAGAVIPGVAATGLATIFANKAGTTLYIGLTVQDSSGEIAPRQALLAVPYAIHAADAAKASGDFPVAGNQTVAGNLSVSGVVSGYGTVPVGTIVMWSGSTVPDGWALCNGQTVNGVQTPNLVDRFIYGSNLSHVRETGGSDKVSVDNLPSHNHLYAGDDMLDRINGNGYTTRVVGRPGNYDADSSGSGLGTVYRTSDTGSGQSFSIMPPYYKLAFIMRVK